MGATLEAAILKFLLEYGCFLAFPAENYTESGLVGVYEPLIVLRLKEGTTPADKSAGGPCGSGGRGGRVLLVSLELKERVLACGHPFCQLFMDVWTV